VKYSRKGFPWETRDPDERGASLSTKRRGGGGLFLNGTKLGFVIIKRHEKAREKKIATSRGLTRIELVGDKKKGTQGR